jgi:poly(A) polymerase
VLARYKKDKAGKLVKQADVYIQDDHNIDPSLFDKDAVAICLRLQQAGFEAYIVGGAVRDLLCGHKPKDFDIATSAHPNKVRRLFKQARIIGRRFKLVHVVVDGEKYFEVATFRAAGSEESNIYGLLCEDAFRRDFTLNALYYNPADNKIIDFHEGVKHIKKRTVETVIPLTVTFKEDPVRMLRAVKYAATTQSRLPQAIRQSIKTHASLLSGCSHSRLSEELLKILACGASGQIFMEIFELGLLKYFLPNLDAYLNRCGKNERHNLWQQLAALDNKDEKTKGRMVYALLSVYIRSVSVLSEGEADETLQTMKMILNPIVLPNRDLLEAVRLMFAEEGIPWHKHKMEDSRQTVRRTRKKPYTRKRLQKKTS